MLYGGYSPRYSLDAEPDSSECNCRMVIDERGYVSLDLCGWAQHYCRIGTWRNPQLTKPEVTRHIRRALRFVASGYKGYQADTVNGRKLRAFARKEAESRDTD